MVQENAGIVPGRIQDDNTTMGASRGACAYRLVPSFELHDNKATHHPTRRPPSAQIKNMAQFYEIQKVLKHPSVDGKGKALKLSAPVGIHRPPTATPRSNRFRTAARRGAAQRPHSHSAGASVPASQDRTVISPGGRSVESPLSLSSLRASSSSDDDDDASPRSQERTKAARSPSRSPGSPESLKSRASSGMRLTSTGMRPASPSIHINAPPVGQ